MGESAVHKAFQTEGNAERKAQGWERMDEECQCCRKEAGGKRQEKLEKRLETEADSGHTGPGMDPHSTPDMVSDV